MPVITQTNNLGDLLKYEAPNLYSREAATIAAGQNLLLGTVLGRNTGRRQVPCPHAGGNGWHRNGHRGTGDRYRRPPDRS